MPYNIFKLIRVKCNYCNDIIISNSEKEWTSCSCGQTKISGKNNYIKINSDNYTDLCIFNKENLPKNIQ